MFFLRIIAILFSTIIYFSVGDSFAASGAITTNSGSTTIKEKSIEKVDKEKKIEKVESSTDTEEKKVEEKKTEINAKKIILEVYKIQGNKILKDMDVSIEKINPNPKIRIEIYSSIQRTLEFRKQKLWKSEMSNDNKDILIWYIDYMVGAIEKRKKTLE